MQAEQLDGASGEVHRCHPCPVCGGRDVHVTLPTDIGAYCRCGGCGEVWHDERHAETPPPERTGAGHILGNVARPTFARINSTTTPTPMRNAVSTRLPISPPCARAGR